MGYEFSTRSIHEGQPKDEGTGSITFPIYQTSTYGQDAPGVNKGYIYSRTGNPIRSALEANLASLEGARFASAFASGMSAIDSAMKLLKTGDHVVTCRDLYGGAYRLFSKVYTKFGISFTFVDATNLDEIEKAFTPETKWLWLETPSNPLLQVTDIEAAAKIGKKHGARVSVDNTFATPYLQSPLKLGADLVIQSTTKYLNGHSDVIGGALITDDPALYEEIKYMQNAAGAIPGPQDCFLTLRGTKTLSIRMDRHCANAREIAAFLEKHPKVERVHYPGLASHPGHEVAKRQMKDFGAMLSFELKADVEEAVKFTSNVELWTLAESLGTVKSLLCHPPTMTHASVEPEVRRANGIPDGLIRLSVGLEDVKDLVDDLKQALDKVRTSVTVG